MTVKALKLITSEEVIGKVVSETDTTITLENVVVITLQQTPSGQAALGFLPFMPYLGRKPLEFSLSKTVLVKEVDEQMENNYNSVFSGIVTPPAKTLIIE